VERIGKRAGEVGPEDVAQIVGGLLELISQLQSCDLAPGSKP
jgi:hypothetical protein